MIKNPTDCLELVRLLVNNFKELSPQQEADLETLNSVGQVAVECVAKNVETANGWLNDWVEEKMDDKNNEDLEEGCHLQELNLYDFLSMCGLFIDSNPELAQELIELEKVFVPLGPQITVKPTSSQPPTRGESRNSTTSRPSVSVQSSRQTAKQPSRQTTNGRKNSSTK